MNDNKVLTDEPSQKVILENPRRADLMSAVTRASSLHAFVGQFKHCDGWRPQESLIAKLCVRKLFGKSAIGFEYALKKSWRHPKEAPRILKQRVLTSVIC